MGENVIGRWLDTTFGFRGRHNILSWAIAGGLAYYLIYLPEQRKQDELKAQHDQKIKLYQAKGIWDVDKVKPVPDKQQNGLIVGSAAQPALPQQTPQHSPTAAATTEAQPATPAADN